MTTIKCDKILNTEIIIGTYEDYVIGYTVECVRKSNTNGTGRKLSLGSKQYSLEQSFAVRAHSGSVRSITTNHNGTFAFSAGFDEMINLFGLKKRKLLHTAEGAYNCTTFADNTHLICGSENSGNIHIYECKNSSMILAKSLIGHKMPITSLSVHPSKKVLLSLSKDNTMRTWNLIKGRSAYVTNIKAQAHLVKWSKTGDEFIIAANNEIYLYNNSGNLEHNLKLEKRVNSIEFITKNIFMVATDSGILEFFDLKEGTPVMKHEAHETRIKSIQLCTINDDDEGGGGGGGGGGDNDNLYLFVTASSDGKVKLWSIDINKLPVKAPKELANVDTGARLTCMTTATYES